MSDRNTAITNTFHIITQHARHGRLGKTKQARTHDRANARMARTYQALRKCGLRMNRWNSDRSAKRRATCRRRRRRRRRRHRLLCRRRCRRRSERPRGLVLYCPLDLILCRSVSLTHSLAVPPERNKKNKTARLHTKRKHGRTASPCMARQSCRALSSAVATTTASARPSPVVLGYARPGAPARLRRSATIMSGSLPPVPQPNENGQEAPSVSLRSPPPRLCAPAYW